MESHYTGRVPSAPASPQSFTHFPPSAEQRKRRGEAGLRALIRLRYQCSATFHPLGNTFADRSVSLSHIRQSECFKGENQPVTTWTWRVFPQASCSRGPEGAKDQSERRPLEAGPASPVATFHDHKVAELVSALKQAD